VIQSQHQNSNELLEAGLALRAGLRAWAENDPFVERPALSKALRDNWDRRIGGLKFGGVWSVAKARQNKLHPASVAALKIDRSDWTGQTVTVEHAVPITVLYDVFMAANTHALMDAVLRAYNVAVVTREEDRRLRMAGLSRSMPVGWQWGDDPYARWHAVGISVVID